MACVCMCVSTCGGPWTRLWHVSVCVCLRVVVRGQGYGMCLYVCVYVCSGAWTRLWHVSVCVCLWV